MGKLLHPTHTKLPDSLIGRNWGSWSHHPLPAQCPSREIRFPHHSPHLGSNNPHSFLTHPLLPSTPPPNLASLAIPPLQPQLPQVLRILVDTSRVRDRGSWILPPFDLSPYIRSLSRLLTSHWDSPRCTSQRRCCFCNSHFRHARRSISHHNCDHALYYWGNLLSVFVLGTVDGVTTVDRFQHFLRFLRGRFCEYECWDHSMGETTRSEC